MQQALGLIRSMREGWGEEEEEEGREEGRGMAGDRTNLIWVPPSRYFTMTFEKLKILVGM